eukprot:ANDGO_01956.mRNA.1 hypothetical protein
MLPPPPSASAASSTSASGSSAALMNGMFLQSRKRPGLSRDLAPTPLTAFRQHPQQTDSRSDSGTDEEDDVSSPHRNANPAAFSQLQLRPETQFPSSASVTTSAFMTLLSSASSSASTSLPTANGNQHNHSNGMGDGSESGESQDTFMEPSAKRPRPSTLEHLEMLRDSLPLSLDEQKCKLVFCKYCDASQLYITEAGWRLFELDFQIPIYSMVMRGVLYCMKPEKPQSHSHPTRESYWNVPFHRFVRAFEMIRWDYSALGERVNARLQSDPEFFSNVFIESFFMHCEGGGSMRCYLPVRHALSMIEQMLPTCPFTPYFLFFLNGRQTNQALTTRPLRHDIPQHVQWMSNRPDLVALLPSISALNFDQWRMFLQFSLTQSSDLHTYSVEDAYPSLIDSFVDFCRRAFAGPPDVDMHAETVNT